MLRGSTSAAVHMLALLCLSAPARAQQPIIVDVRQGTDISVAVAPDASRIVVDLLGQLWEMPITGGAARPLTPTDESARQPRFSPDGKLIAYERHFGDQADIWLLDTVTGERRALTNEAADDREPDFLPGSDTVVFASNRAGHFGLWTQVLDGTPAQPLVLESGDARYPTVSERGDIAYVSATSDGRHALKAFSRGTSRVLLTTDMHLSAPSWRPGGGVVVYHSTDETTSSSLNMIILSEQPIVRVLTRDEDAFAARASWLSPTEYLYAADGQIWRRSLGGFSRKPVHLFAAVSIEPATPPGYRFSGDSEEPQSAHGLAGTSGNGKTLAFAALGDIWLDVNGKLRQLTDDAAWDFEPALADDGSFVVYASARGGRSELWRVSTDGSPPQSLIATNRQLFAPALDSTGTRLAYLSAADPGPNATATLHVRYLDDGARVDGTAALQALEPPDPPLWIDDPEAALSVQSRESAGVERIVFDAALREVRREPGSTAPRPAPTTVPQWTAQPPLADRFVIQAGRLFDGLGAEYRRHVDIHVENRRITAVVARGVLPLPATVIDAREATVLPGFIDAHVHDQPRAGNWLGRSLLGYGVTTARMLAVDGAAALARAETWASGHAPGPRAIVAADSGTAAPLAPRDYPIVVADTQGILDDPVRGFGSSAVGLPRELTRALTAVDGQGATPAALQRRFSPLLGQYQDVLGTIVASGYVEITGLSILAPNAVDKLLAARPDNRRDYDRLLPAEQRVAWRGAISNARALAARQEALARLIRGGARVAVGSEAPLVPPGISFLVELDLLAAAGIPNDQVLRLATVGGALALGIDRDLGSLEPGKLADLIVVDGDPLARLSDITRIRGTVVGGRWFERAALIDADSPP